jgi:peptide/nickel transport system substrate-binding protein
MMSKNMSRRGFVKASAVAGASAMLAACGGNSGSGAATDGATKKALYFGQSNPKEGFDMQKSTNSGESAIADSIVESPLRWT